MLTRGGCPGPIIHTYFDFVDELSIINTLPGGAVGAPHSRARGIPQGGPLSMLMSTFLLHSWVARVKMITYGPSRARPRALADDMAVTSFGEQVRGVIESALGESIDYIRAMGGREGNPTRTLEREERFEGVHRLLLDVLSILGLEGRQ